MPEQERRILRDALKCRELVEAPAERALHGRTVVANLPEDERAVQLADFLERVKHTPDFVVGLRGIGGKDLHQPRGHAPLVRRQGSPGGDLFRPWSEFRVRRNDAKLELALMSLLTIPVPALVEWALELFDPRLRHMVRSVGGAGGVVDEEGTVGRD